MSDGRTLDQKIDLLNTCVSSTPLGKITCSHDENMSQFVDSITGVNAIRATAMRSMRRAFQARNSAPMRSNSTLKNTSISAGAANGTPRIWIVRQKAVQVMHQERLARHDTLLFCWLRDDLRYRCPFSSSGALHADAFPMASLRANDMVADSTMILAVLIGTE